MDTPTERIDKIIYHTLTCGAKRRSEILALLGNVAAEQTIDKHLSYLTEQDHIRKISSSEGECTIRYRVLWMKTVPHSEDRISRN